MCSIFGLAKKKKEKELGKETLREFYCFGGLILYLNEWIGCDNGIAIQEIFGLHKCNMYSW